MSKITPYFLLFFGNFCSYNCKNLTRQAFILEGLQGALNLFETMKQRYPPGESVQRCCILITQSTPMTNPWSPTSPEKVILELKRVSDNPLIFFSFRSLSFRDGFWITKSRNAWIGLY